jgi:hypothetical protein
VSAITTFPAWSTATPQAAMVARLAGPPAPNGPADPVPAGVVNWSVCSLTFRTEVSARYSWPAENATPDSPLPQALDGAVLLASDICVAGPGPPTPPATVVITPPAARCMPAGALPAGGLAATGLAAAGAASAPPPAISAAEVTTARTGIR